MKRLIVLAVVAVTAWYGWKHYSGLRSGPMHLAVIQNETGQVIERVRVSIGGQGYPAYDTIAAGERVTQKFPLAAHDGAFRIRWVVRGQDVDREWSGGMVTAGPVPTRHVLQLTRDGGVVWSSAPIPAPAGR